MKSIGTLRNIQSMNPFIVVMTSYDSEIVYFRKFAFLVQY